MDVCIRVFCFLLVCSTIYAQDEKVVAKVGDFKIFESEFRNRFDFSAKPRLLNSSDKSESKREFLKQLIAEKLLSLEARERGYNKSDSFANIITPLENMFIRDALYTQEIKDKVQISDKDIAEGINRISKVLNIKFLFSQNPEELEEKYQILNSGASFDSLLSLRPESEKNPREVTFGTMDKEAEDAVYLLKPLEFTPPLEADDGHYILKLIDTKENSALKSRDMVYEDVRRIVQTRSEYKSYLSYYHKIFNDKKVTADKDIFELIIKVLVPDFKEKYADSRAISGSGRYFLRGSEITDRFAETNQEIIFIKTKDPVDLRHFLNQLSHDGLYVTFPKEINIRASLSSYIRKFIEDQLLTAEGRGKGLGNSQDVVRSVRMWEDSYLSRYMMSSIYDSIYVSDEDAYFIYKQNEWKDYSPQLVNIVEIFTDSLETVEKILNDLSDGKDIRELAKHYTKRDSLRERRGEFGYFPVTMNGEIGRIASRMNIGDIYGPISIDGGYSVFQLTGRKEDDTFRDKSFEEVKDNLKTFIKLQRFKEKVNEYNASLAIKYGVEIDENVLEGIDNIFLNLVVVRYMGFGGEIFAVPYTEQFSGWYDLWEQNKKLNP